MDRFWEIASPATWALTILASACLLLGFVLLSHSLVRQKAYGDEWHGWLATGRLEWTVRTGTALLFAGFGLWSITLGAPWWVIAPLGLGALAGSVGFSRREEPRSRVSDSNR